MSPEEIKKVKDEHADTVKVTRKTRNDKGIPRGQVSQKHANAGKRKRVEGDENNSRANGDRIQSRKAAKKMKGMMPSRVQSKDFVDTEDDESEEEDESGADDD